MYYGRFRKGDGVIGSLVTVPVSPFAIPAAQMPTMVLQIMRLRGMMHCHRYKLISYGVSGNGCSQRHLQARDICFSTCYERAWSDVLSQCGPVPHKIASLLLCRL